MSGILTAIEVSTMGWLLYSPFFMIISPIRPLELYFNVYFF